MSTTTITEAKTETAEALAVLHAAVAEISTSEEWLAWLGFLSKLHDYSFLNRIWMWVQWEGRKAADPTLPELGQCAGFKAWKEMGRNVRKGEKALSVFAPVIITDHKAPLVDGKPAKKCIGFKVIKRTFAVAQTDGVDLPESPAQPTLVQGELDEGLWEKLVAIAALNGFAVFEQKLNGPNGTCCYSTKTITIEASLPGAQKVKTMIHELAHSLMHNPADYLTAHRGPLNVIEVEAESVAYTVAAMLGIDTACYSTGYVASWSGGDGELVKNTAIRVLDGAERILSAIETGELAKAKQSAPKEEG